MSVVEYRDILFEVSEEIGWFDCSRLLFICRIFLPTGSEDTIKDALSLFIKLEEENHLSIDYLDVLKDLLKRKAKWNLLETVENFEAKRRKYKDLLKQFGRVLDECNQLERLISICERNVSRGKEVKEADIKDVCTLLTKLEETNCLAFGRLDILKTIAIEMEKPDLLKQVEEFEKKRKQEEDVEKERNKLEESRKRIFNGSGHPLFVSSANKGTGLLEPGQQTSLFGQKTTTSTPGFQAQTKQTRKDNDEGTGTPVKFSVVQGTDSIVKNGVTTNINVGLQCITNMPNYEKKSIEELRIEDYEAGRKTDVSGSTGFSSLSTSTSSGSLFGNTSTTGFGTSSSPTGFETTAGAFGHKTGSPFGIPTLSTTFTGFGSGSGTTTGFFGQSTTGQTTGLVGTAPSSTGTGLFGAQRTGQFGQTSTGSLFGQTGLRIGQQQGTSQENTCEEKQKNTESRQQTAKNKGRRFGRVKRRKEQSTAAFEAKPFGASPASGATGSLFDGTQNMPQTGFNFGSFTAGLDTSTGSSTLGFGTGTAFGGSTGCTGLFGTTGTSDRTVAVLTSAKYVGEKLIGVVTLHCTFRNAADDIVAVTTLMTLRRSSSLKEFVNSFNEAVLPTANTLRSISEGSLCFTVQAENRSALKALWERYRDGTLKKNLQEFLVTEQIKQLGDGEVTVTVQIDEQEYENALLDLMKIETKGPKVEKEEKGRLRARASSDSDLYCHSRAKEIV